MQKKKRNRAAHQHYDHRQRPSTLWRWLGPSHPDSELAGLPKLCQSLVPELQQPGHGVHLTAAREERPGAGLLGPCPDRIGLLLRALKRGKEGRVWALSLKRAKLQRVNSGAAKKLTLLLLPLSELK